MLDLVGPFIFGLLGSAHCLGMCGPLVLAYSLHLRPGDRSGRSGLWPASAAHHLAFHGGRLFTYSLLGALAAGITQIPAFHHVFAFLRGSVTLGGGVLMICFGLGLAGILPARLFPLPVWGPAATGRGVFHRLFSSKGLPSKLALGILSGFLPCMLSLAMIVKAATTASLLLGFATMLLFGLGTLPALFLTGFSASLLSMKARLLGERVAGAMTMVMGVMLIIRGGRYFLCNV
jgi:hypothetical protein